MLISWQQLIEDAIQETFPNSEASKAIYVFRRYCCRYGKCTHRRILEHHIEHGISITDHCVNGLRHLLMEYASLITTKCCRSRAATHDEFLDMINISLNLRFVVMVDRTLRCMFMKLNMYYLDLELATLVLTRACHNWVYKPICKDKTLGIIPRLMAKRMQWSAETMETRT
jgi:hypothetical protein